MNRFVLPVLLLGALVALLVVGLNRDPGYVPSPLIGKPAPDFVLPRLDNPTVSLSRSDLLGDVSVLNVWATWCGGCRQEHAFLVELARTSDVRIFGLNWKDDAGLARQWLNQLGNPYAVTGVDQDGRVAIDWGVYGAPETFLIDATGVVLYKHIAPLTPEVWAAEFYAAHPQGSGVTTLKNTVHLLCLLAIVSISPAWAVDAEPPIDDPAQKALYEDLLHEVRCLVCQNQTIGDSTAPLAADLRREIRRMVIEGKSEADIKAFLLARYGDFVLYRPQFKATTALLWLAPLLLLLTGAIALARVLRRRAGLPADLDADENVSPAEKPRP